MGSMFCITNVSQKLTLYRGSQLVTTPAAVSCPVLFRPQVSDPLRCLESSRSGVSALHMLTLLDSYHLVHVQLP